MLIINFRLIGKEVLYLENKEELWGYILAEMESKMSKPSYDTWLSQTKVYNLVNDTLSIIVPNEFTKTWLDQHYTQVINTLLYEKTGVELSVRFDIEDGNFADTEEKNKVDTPPIANNDALNMLNPNTHLIHLLLVQQTASHMPQH